MKTSRGVIPLVAAILGVVVLGWAFITGIGAALSDSGSGALPFEVIFIVAMLVILAALIIAIVNLVRGHTRVLAIITIVVALLPLIAIVMLRVSAM
jgi:hypothetical protein